MTINQQQDAIIDEFADMDDWMDRYQLLIDMGNELEALDEKYKTNQNLIDGCQSRVWVQCDYRDGRLYFQADSDALIVKGIIALLIQVLSGHTPAEILDTDLYFIDRIGLRDHLSPTRSNGLLAMIKQIKAYALAYKTKGGGMMRTISIVCCGSAAPLGGRRRPSSGQGSTSTSASGLPCRISAPPTAPRCHPSYVSSPRA